MRPKKYGLYTRIAIIVLCLGGGMLLHIIYEKYLQETVFAAVLVNVIALAGLYVWLHFHYMFRRRAIAAKVTAALDNIKNGLPVEGADTHEEYAAMLAAAADLETHIAERERTRTDIMTLLNSAASNMELESMLNSLLPKIITSSGSAWGAFYLANDTTGKLEIKASFGFSKNIYSEFDIAIGEGFLGMAALSRETLVVHDLPDDSVFVTRTFLGKFKPKSMLAVPVVKQEELVGVLALAAINDYTPAQQATVRIIQEYIGAAVGNSVAYEHSKRLMGELRFQNNLIRDLYDEMEKKAQAAAGRTDEGARLVADLCVRAFGDDTRGVLITDAHGGVIFAGAGMSALLTGTEDGLEADVSVFTLFTEPDRVAAFASLGQGTDRFRLQSGETAEAAAFAAKDGDGQTKYIFLKIEVA